MPRPKTKRELLVLSKKNYEELNTLVDSFSEIEREMPFPKGLLNRNIRDVLAHLHHWHLMFISWYDIGMSGHKPDMPAKGYTWKDTPKLNKAIQEKYANHKLFEIRKELTTSFNAIQNIIMKHSDTELFEKKKYRWTGSTSLGVYLVSATSSHYAWAIKLIKRAKQ